MEVIHVYESCNGYEVVELISNRVSRKNHLHVIKKHGELFYTGGFILDNTTFVKTFLSQFSPTDQYNAVKNIRSTPFVKSYLEE